jgi:hypothetical protein
MANFVHKNKEISKKKKLSSNLSGLFSKRGKFALGKPKPSKPIPLPSPILAPAPVYTPKTPVKENKFDFKDDEEKIIDSLKFSTPRERLQKRSLPRKISPKTIIGSFVLLLLFVGTVAAFGLTRINQDIRQQASEGEPYCGDGICQNKWNPCACLADCGEEDGADQCAGSQTTDSSGNTTGCPKYYGGVAAENKCESRDGKGGQVQICKNGLWSAHGGACSGYEFVSPPDSSLCLLGVGNDDWVPAGSCDDRNGRDQVCRNGYWSNPSGDECKAPITFVQDGLRTVACDTDNDVETSPIYVKDKAACDAAKKLIGGVASFFDITNAAIESAKNAQEVLERIGEEEANANVSAGFKSTPETGYRTLCKLNGENFYADSEETCDNFGGFLEVAGDLADHVEDVVDQVGDKVGNVGETIVESAVLISEAQNQEGQTDELETDLILMADICERVTPDYGTKKANCGANWSDEECKCVDTNDDDFSDDYTPMVNDAIDYGNCIMNGGTQEECSFTPIDNGGAENVQDDDEGEITQVDCQHKYGNLLGDAKNVCDDSGRTWDEDTCECEGVEVLNLISESCMTNPSICRADQSCVDSRCTVSCTPGEIQCGFLKLECNSDGTDWVEGIDKCNLVESAGARLGEIFSGLFDDENDSSSDLIDDQGDDSEFSWLNPVTWFGGLFGDSGSENENIDVEENDEVENTVDQTLHEACIASCLSSGNPIGCDNKCNQEKKERIERTMELIGLDQDEEGCVTVGGIKRCDPNFIGEEVEDVRVVNQLEGGSYAYEVRCHSFNNNICSNSFFKTNDLSEGCLEHLGEGKREGYCPSGESYSLNPLILNDNNEENVEVEDSLAVESNEVGDQTLADIEGDLMTETFDNDISREGDDRMTLIGDVDKDGLSDEGEVALGEDTLTVLVEFIKTSISDIFGGDDDSVSDQSNVGSDSEDKVEFSWINPVTWFGGLFGGDGSESENVVAEEAIPENTDEAVAAQEEPEPEYCFIPGAEHFNDGKRRCLAVIKTETMDCEPCWEERYYNYDSETDFCYTLAPAGEIIQNLNTNIDDCNQYGRANSIEELRQNPSSFPDLSFND